MLRGVVLAVLLGHLAEVGRRHLGAHRLGLAADRVADGRRRVLRHHEQDVVRRVEVAGGALVAALRARVARQLGGHRLHELAQLGILDHAGRGRVDRLGVVERVAARGGGGEELVGHPQVTRDELRDLAIDRHLHLGVADHVAEARHGELLRTGARDDIHVGGERVLEAAAAGQGGRAQDEDEDRKTCHEIRLRME
jgi:hypothetical protein